MAADHHNNENSAPRLVQRQNSLDKPIVSLHRNTSQCNAKIIDTIKRDQDIVLVYSNKINITDPCSIMLQYMGVEYYVKV